MDHPEKHSKANNGDWFSCLEPVRLTKYKQRSKEIEFMYGMSVAHISRNRKSNASDLKLKRDASAASTYQSSFDFSAGELSFEKSTKSGSDNDVIAHLFQNTIEQYLAGNALLGEQLRAYMDSVDDSSEYSSELGSSFDGNSGMGQISGKLSGNKTQGESVESYSTNSSPHNNSTASVNNRSQNDDSTRMPPQVPRIFKATSNQEDTVVRNLIQKTNKATYASTINPFHGSQRLTNVAKLRQSRSPEVLKMFRSLRPKIKSKMRNTVRTYQATSPIYSVTHHVPRKSEKSRMDTENSIVDPKRLLSPLYSVRHNGIRNKKLNRLPARDETKVKDSNKDESISLEKKGSVQIMRYFTKDGAEKHQFKDNQLFEDDKTMEKFARDQTSVHPNASSSIQNMAKIERILQKRLERLDKMLECKRMLNELSEESPQHASSPDNLAIVNNGKASKRETHTGCDNFAFERISSQNYDCLAKFLVPILKDVKTIDDEEENEIVFIRDGGANDGTDSIWESPKLWETWTPLASPKAVEIVGNVGNDRLSNSAKDISQSRKMPLLDLCEREESTICTPSVLCALPNDRAPFAKENTDLDSNPPRASTTNLNIATSVANVHLQSGTVLSRDLKDARNPNAKFDFTSTEVIKGETASIVNNEQSTTPSMSPSVMNILDRIKKRSHNREADYTDTKLNDKQKRFSSERNLNAGASKENCFAYCSEHAEKNTKSSPKSFCNAPNEECNGLTSHDVDRDGKKPFEHPIQVEDAGASDKLYQASVTFVNENGEQLWKTLNSSPVEMAEEFKPKILLSDFEDFEVIQTRHSQSTPMDCEQASSEYSMEGENFAHQGQASVKTAMCLSNANSLENEIPKLDSKFQILCDNDLLEFEIKRARSPMVTEQDESSLCPATETTNHHENETLSFTATQPVESHSGTVISPSSTHTMKNLIPMKNMLPPPQTPFGTSSLKTTANRLNEGDIANRTNRPLYDSEGNVIYLNEQSYAIKNANPLDQPMSHAKHSPISRKLKRRNTSSNHKYVSSQGQGHVESNGSNKVKRTRRLRLLKVLECCKKQLKRSFDAISKEGKKNVKKENVSYASTTTGSSKDSEENVDNRSTNPSSSSGAVATNCSTHNKSSHPHYGDDSNSILEAKTDVNEEVDSSITNDEQKHATQMTEPSSKKMEERSIEASITKEDVVLHGRYFFLEKKGKTEARNGFKSISIIIPTEKSRSADQETAPNSATNDGGRSNIVLDPSTGRHVLKVVRSTENLTSSLRRFFRKDKLHNTTPSMPNRPTDRERRNHIIFKDDLIDAFHDDKNAHDHSNRNGPCGTPYACPQMTSIIHHSAQENSIECMIGLHPFEADGHINENTVNESRSRKIKHALTEYITKDRPESRHHDKRYHRHTMNASKSIEKENSDKTTDGATYTVKRSSSELRASVPVDTAAKNSQLSQEEEKSLSTSVETGLTLEEKIFARRLANDVKILAKIENKRMKLGKSVADSKVEDLEKSLELLHSIKKSMKARRKKENVEDDKIPLA